MRLKPLLKSVQPLWSHCAVNRNPNLFDFFFLFFVPIVVNSQWLRKEHSFTRVKTTKNVKIFSSVIPPEEMCFSGVSNNFDVFNKTVVLTLKGDTNLQFWISYLVQVLLCNSRYLIFFSLLEHQMPIVGESWQSWWVKLGGAWGINNHCQGERKS